MTKKLKTKEGLGLKSRRILKVSVKKLPKEIHIKRSGKLLRKKELERLPEISHKRISEIKKELKKQRKKKAAAGKIMGDIDGAGEIHLKTKGKKMSSKRLVDGNSSEGESDGFFKTYIPGFDSLVPSGIPKGFAILIEGGPGSGKTLWCLTLLSEMCKRGKKVLYMSFEEPEERLRSHIDSFGVSAKELEKKGLLYIKRFNALDIARSVEALLSEAKKELLIDVQPVLIPKNFNPDIVLIDSLSSISSAFSGESSRFRIYMEQLFRYLEGNHITSLLIREVASPTHIGGTFVEQGEAVSFLSDGIIAIYNVIDETGIRKRAIEVLKMRGVHIERKIVGFEITGKGVVVYPNKVLKGNYKLT